MTGRSSNRTSSAYFKAIEEVALKRSTPAGISSSLSHDDGTSTSAREAQKALGCSANAARAKSRDRRRCVAYTLPSQFEKNSPATLWRSAYRSDVCPVTAASQADASAFFTPNDDSGSMKEPASPTRRNPRPAYGSEEYSEASHAHSCRSTAPSSRARSAAVFATARRYGSPWPTITPT